MTDDTASPAPDTLRSLWRFAGMTCVGVILASVLACVAIAAVRSNGLTAVTVTALDADKEPRDHRIPFIKQKDALPDYEVLIYLYNGRRLKLGTKPNTTAVNGLTWTLNDPVSVTDVATVRLQDQDKLVSDAIAEVQVSDRPVTADNFRFEFVMKRSTSVGVQSFFRTPIGRAIAGAFFLAVLILLASVFLV